MCSRGCRTCARGRKLAGSRTGESEEMSPVRAGAARNTSAAVEDEAIYG